MPREGAPVSMKDGIIEEIRGLLARRKNPVPDRPIEEQTLLFTEGLDLDSLETAEFSALLEVRFGSDPFTDGQIPQSVGEVLAYYNRSS
jgi:acyl carrier protein